MHTDTLKDIRELESLLSAKMDRINALENLNDKIQATYGTMTKSQQKKALREIQEMREELTKERAWCDKALNRIKAFYRPATVVA